MWTSLTLNGPEVWGKLTYSLLKCTRHKSQIIANSNLRWASEHYQPNVMFLCSPKWGSDNQSLLLTKNWWLVATNVCYKVSFCTNS